MKNKELYKFAFDKPLIIAFIIQRGIYLRNKYLF